MVEKKQPLEQRAEKQPKSFWTMRNIILVIAGVAVLIGGAIGIAVAANPPAEEPSDVVEELPEALDPNAALDSETDVQQDSETQTTQESLTNDRIDAELLQSIDSYTYTDETLADEYGKAIVATVGDHELTNGLLQVFYWAQVGYFINSYGEYASYLGFDASVSPAEQSYGEGMTWEQYFLEMALDEYLQYCVLYDEATKRGIEPTEEVKAGLATLAEDLEAYAVEGGFTSAEDYLYQTFGPGVTREDYAEYYELYETAKLYSKELRNSIELSDQEVELFYEVNASSYEQEGVYKINRNVVNVRHILIEPEKDIDTDEDLEPDSSSERAWAAAEQAANDTYERWKQNPTEANFATVATDTTYDTQSAENGGLYEGIYPGQMNSSEFESWCFDETRQPGDHEIIRSEYGYHIMYFVSEGDYMYWYSVAENDCIDKNFDAKMDDLLAKYPMEPNYSNIHMYDVLAAKAARAAQ
ncbi:MAG: hypothetical protein E7464_05840 [Ruminococcaceae bacterium]|nr:hypothetical protein [Oscillospiraceae bacterium]